MRSFRFLVFFLFTALGLHAQEKLNLQQAIEIALQKNYGINIARTDASISKISNSYGNAGFLPTITLLGGLGRSSYNTKQEFNSGASVNRKNALSSNLNSSVALSWTLFDGMKMFATKDRLETLEAQGETNLKIAMENTVKELIVLYFDVVRQQQLIKATRESIKISEEREKIARKKFEIGSGSKLDLLQATVDLNAQRSQLLRLNTSIQGAIASLNQLLTKNTGDTYSVEDSISINTSLGYESLKQNLSRTNNQLKLSQQNIEIANYNLKEVKSAALPQVGMNVAYNVSNTRNQVGLILLNQNIGLNAGLTASWTLFDGTRNKTQAAIARYNVLRTTIQLDNLRSTLDVSLLNAWRSYQNALEILKLEEGNIDIAEENVRIALERFRLGSSTTIELMIAQQSYQDALTRLVSIRYEAKLAETELLRLEGTLVK
jgi:outer membrane protein